MGSYFSRAFDGVTERFALPYVDAQSQHPYSNALVWDCLQTIAASRQSRITRNCRLFVNGNQVNVFAAKDLIQRICKFPSIEAVEWDKLFGADEFHMFVNHAALYSADLLEASKTFMGDFADRFEPQGISVEHHLIIGRYTQTPFGVHVDDPTDRVFHFNLGPSGKSMTLWRRPEFMRRYSGDAGRPVDRVSPEGSATYNIAPQSAFFLPADYHHVGRSDGGVSIVVAVAISRQCEGLLLRDALRELRELLPPCYASANYYESFEGEAVGMEEMFASYDAVGLTAASRHAQARRKSNKNFIEILPLQVAPLHKLYGVYALRDGREPIAIKHAGYVYLYSAGHRAILKRCVLVDEFERIMRERRFEILRHPEKHSPLAIEVSALQAWFVATGAACAISQIA